MTSGDTPFEIFSEIEGFDLDAVALAFDPARLTQARQAAGMTKAKLADLVGVTAAAIGQYEARVVAPRKTLLSSLAKALDVPPMYFAAGRPIGRVDGAQVHFRSLRSTSSRDRSKALAFIEQVWELSVALEKRVRFPAVDLPDLDGLDPKAAAVALRRYWGLDKGPVRHLVALIESKGIIVSLLTLANADVARVGAFSTSHLERPIIVITPERARSIYTYRFTIAHELGHLLMHRDTNPGDLQQEREADQFAADFLTPRNEIANLLPRALNFALLHQLSRHWGVSVESLLYRMKELGVVSEAAIRRGFQRLNQLRDSGIEAAEPLNAYPGEMPSLLREAVAVASRHGTDPIDISNELKWKPYRLREVVGETSSRPSLRVVPE